MTKRLNATDLTRLLDGVPLSTFPPEALKRLDDSLVSTGFTEGTSAFEDVTEIIAVADAFSLRDPPFQTQGNGILDTIRELVISK